MIEVGPAEYSREDSEQWKSLTLRKGQVIEAEVPVGSDVTLGDALAGFLVQRVCINVQGELVVEARSLGAADPRLSKTLTNNFNRRRGAIHLCGPGCGGDGDYALHLTALKLYDLQDFTADYVSTHHRRSIQKRIDEDLGELEDTGERVDVTLEPLEEDIAKLERMEMDIHGPPEEGGAKAAPKRPRKGVAAVPGPAKDPRKEEKHKTSGGEKQIDREALRERLARVKARVTGGGPGPAPVLAGVAPGEHEGVCPEEPSSPGYSSSPLPEGLEDGTYLRSLGPSAPAGLKEDWKKRADKEEKKKRGPPKEPEREKELRLVATSAGVTSNLQRQLLQRAADAAARKAKEGKQEKKKAKKKDVSAQLLKILTGRKDKKKKDGKKKKKKKREGKDPGGDGSGSEGGGSSSSPTSSSGLDYNRSSDEESSRASDKLEAPLKRRSKEKPGSVLALLVEHARQQLDQTSKVTFQSPSRSNPTQGVKLSSYFAIVLRPQLGPMSAAMRKLHLLANGMDMLRQGDLNILGDLLASRFMSIHQSIIDGGWGTAKHLELLPLEDNTAAGNAVVLEARRHARLATRLASQEVWTGNGGPRGRGGRGKGQNWGDSQWLSGDNNNKGKGKKGGKGKGKQKNSWGNQHQGEGDSGAGKVKERIPEK